MKNVKTVVALSVVAIALGGVPCVVSSFMDKKIEEYKTILATNGIKQEIISK